MKAFNFTSRCRALLLFLAALLSAPQLASAVQMSVYVSTPSQWGTGSAFYHGHTVLASTPFSTLNAGGAFTVQCNHPATLPMSGERALSSSTYGFDRNILTVTIPAQQPALRNVSGWLQIPGNTYLSCNYRWTAIRDGGWLQHWRGRHQLSHRQWHSSRRRHRRLSDLPSVQRRRRRGLHALIASLIPFINTKDGSHEKSQTNLCPGPVRRGAPCLQRLGPVHPHRHRSRQQRHQPRARPASVSIST